MVLLVSFFPSSFSPQLFRTSSLLQYNVPKSTVTSLHVFFIDQANQIYIWEKKQLSLIPVRQAAPRMRVAKFFVKNYALRNGVPYIFKQLSGLVHCALYKLSMSHRNSPTANRINLKTFLQNCLLDTLKFFLPFSMLPTEYYYPSLPLLAYVTAKPNHLASLHAS